MNSRRTGWAAVISRGRRSGPLANRLRLSKFEEADITVPICSRRLNTLSDQLTQAWQKLRGDELSREQNSLQEQMSAPNFWQDNQRAQALTRQEAKLQALLSTWLKLQQEVN